MMHARQTSLGNLAKLGSDVKSKRWSSYDQTGGNVDFWTVSTGETRVLGEMKGAGCIRHIWMTTRENDNNLRRLVLRIYWDGETTPSVVCPLGDFFGLGHARATFFESLPLQVSYLGMNCWFPMPYSSGAKITITNDSDINSFLYFYIDYQEWDRSQEDLGWFHACWHREVVRNLEKEKKSDGCDAQLLNTTGNENYVLLDVTGKGHYVGCTLHIDTNETGWWGEGDDMFFIDGESWPPSFHGTGSEEIFGGGACPDVEYSGPYTGFHLVENREEDSWYGKTGMYRFFVHDPIRFRKSIRVTIEHGHANDLANDYSSVAYWYQAEPHAPFPALPSREGRAVVDPPPIPSVEGAIEAERLLKDARSSGDRAQALRFPGTWSAARFLWYVADAVDDFITIQVPVEAAGTYDVVLYLAKASDFGMFQLKVDGKKVGAPFDGYNGKGGWGLTHVVRAEAVSFGAITLTPGRRAFEFRVVGKNPAATSYMIGVDCIVLRRRE